MDRSTTFPSEHLDSFIASLAEQHWGRSSALFPTSLLQGLREEALTHFAQDEMDAAGIGKSADQEQSIRKTYIRWFQEENMGPAEQELWQRLDALRVILNRTCFLALRSFECHFAIYPAGGYYRRHLDQFHTDRSRLLSFALYLNPDWREPDGGQLRLFIPTENKEEVVDIPPSLGQFAMFQSAALEHEVLLTHKERVCVIGWMKTGPINPLSG